MRWVKYGFARAWWRVKLFVWNNAIKLVLALLVLAAVIVYMLPDIVVTINAGESGVLWRRFGGGTMTVAGGRRSFRSRIAASRFGDPVALNEDGAPGGNFVMWPYSEGMHWKWPWDKVYIYNIRLQEVSANYDALTNDGLAIKTEVTIRWKPIEEDLGKLHREIGPDYVNTLLVPLVGSFARQEIAAQRPDALYSPERLGIQERIREKTKAALVVRFHAEANRESYLIVEDVLIRNVELPDDVASAIERKVVEKQQAEAYEYRLLREKQEAERKAIEADGIRRFQETINSTISEGYLRWKGIEATLELAKSENAKVVVIGAGEQGMPIILGGLDGTGPPTVTARRPAPAATPPPGAGQGAGAEADAAGAAEVAGERRMTPAPSAAAGAAATSGKSTTATAKPAAPASGKATTGASSPGAPAGAAAPAPPARPPAERKQ